MWTRPRSLLTVVLSYRRASSADAAVLCVALKERTFGRQMEDAGQKVALKRPFLLFINSAIIMKEAEEAKEGRSKKCFNF